MIITKLTDYINLRSIKKLKKRFDEMIRRCESEIDDREKRENKTHRK